MTVIQIYDPYKIDSKFEDFIAAQPCDKAGPIGYVRLIKNNKPITTFMPNLVTVPGRRFVAQKLFNKKYGTDPTLYTDYLVTHFGLGSGGSTIVGQSVTLNGPNLCDTDLITPIQLDIGNSNYLTSPGDSHYVTPTPATANVCKRIESDGTISVIENTSVSCSSPWYTWVQCRCFKAIGEPTSLSTGESVRIDEACLYYTDIGAGGTTAYTFAHICFGPKWIEKESELIIEWYILC